MSETRKKKVKSAQNPKSLPEILIDRPPLECDVAPDHKKPRDHEDRRPPPERPIPPPPARTHFQFFTKVLIFQKFRFFKKIIFLLFKFLRKIKVFCILGKNSKIIDSRKIQGKTKQSYQYHAFGETKRPKQSRLDSRCKISIS